MVELTVTSQSILDKRDKGKAEEAQDLRNDIQKLSDFIHSLRIEGADADSLLDRRERLWHALDHMRMLSRDLASPVQTPPDADANNANAEAKQALDGWLSWAEGTSTNDGESTVAEMAKASKKLAAIRKERRVEMLDQLSFGNLQPADTMNTLDSLRWYDGAFHHAWKLTDSLWKAAENGSAEGL